MPWYVCGSFVARRYKGKPVDFQWFSGFVVVWYFFPRYTPPLRITHYNLKTVCKCAGAYICIGKYHITTSTTKCVKPLINKGF